MNGNKKKDEQAAEVWRRIFAFFMITRPQRDLVLERLGLTPNDARAFSSLDEGGGRTMRSLADEWGCDASNATWMVDRLERRGFAERRTLASDRRVKLVVLTPAGAKAKQELLAGMNEPPPALRDLDQADLEDLVVAVRKLPLEAEALRLAGPSGEDGREGPGRAKVRRSGAGRAERPSRV